MYYGRFTLTSTAWDAFDRLMSAYSIPTHAPTTPKGHRA